MGPKNGGLGENGGQNLRYWFRDPQTALPCARAASFDVFCVKIGARLGGSLSQEPPPKKVAESLVPRGAKSRVRRTETPEPIWIKFCMVVDIPE